MIDDPLLVLPDARRCVAEHAIKTVVGATAARRIRPLTGGVSGAFVFLVEAGAHRFVLRLEGPASPLRNPHQYDSMRVAAAQGIAPPLHYLDAGERVVVIEYIEDRPLETYPGGAHGLAQAVGALLRRLQAAPVFAPFDYLATVRRLWTHVGRTGLFANGLLDEASNRLAAIGENSPLETTVSSHNDVLPRNLLFDGKRLWLIDWENAYRNDPLVDVATALDNFAPSRSLEETLLTAWLGFEPDRRLRDRLTNVRALTRLFYAGVLFSAAAAHPRDEAETSLAALSAAEFERAIRSGELAPETSATSLALGKMYLASFLSGDLPPGLPPMYMR